MLLIVREDCFKKEGILESEPKLARFLSREREEDINTEKRFEAVLRSKLLWLNWSDGRGELMKPWTDIRF